MQTSPPPAPVARDPLDPGAAEPGLSTVDAGPARPVPTRIERLRAAARPNVVWRWTGRLALALLLAVAIGYVPYRVYVRSGLSQYMKLRDELLRLQAMNQALRVQAAELRAQLERLHDDDGEIERVARDELGLVRTGEIVFKVE